VCLLVALEEEEEEEEENMDDEEDFFVGDDTMSQNSILSSTSQINGEYYSTDDESTHIYDINSDHRSPYNFEPSDSNIVDLQSKLNLLFLKLTRLLSHIELEYVAEILSIVKQSHFMQEELIYPTSLKDIKRDYIRGEKVTLPY